MEVMGNTRDKERRLGVRRGGTTQRIEYAKQQQEYRA